MNAQITTRTAGSSTMDRISLEEAIALIDAPNISPGIAAEEQARIDAESQPLSPADLTDVVDMSALMARCMGNLPLVLRVVSKFQSTGTADLQQIASAIELSDYETIARISHRFKGAAGNISATRLHLMAAYIEQSAREQSLTEIREAFAQASREWDSFVQFASSVASRDIVSKANTRV